MDWEKFFFVFFIVFFFLSSLIVHTYVWYNRLEGKKMHGIYMQIFGFFIMGLSTLIMIWDISKYHFFIAIIGFIICLVGQHMHEKVAIEYHTPND